MREDCVVGHPECTVHCRRQFHPDMDRFIDEYIAEVIERTAEYNAMLEVSGSRSVCWHAVAAANLGSPARLLHIRNCGKLRRRS